MERWILLLCHEKSELKSLYEEWKKEDFFVQIMSDVREVARELSGNTDYLLIIIFSDGQEYLLSLKIIRGLTKAPILVLNRQYNSTEKTAAIRPLINNF